MTSNHMQVIDLVRNPKPALIKIVAVFQTLYAVIEVTDCIVVFLMSLDLIENPYPKMVFPEMQQLFENRSIWIVPLFIFYTSLRIVSAIGLWKNRLWGFWLTIFVSAATLLMAPFLLPFTAAEMLMNGILITLLLIGFFGEAQMFHPEIHE